MRMFPELGVGVCLIMDSDVEPLSGGSRVALGGGDVCMFMQECRWPWLYGCVHTYVHAYAYHMNICGCKRFEIDVLIRQTARDLSLKRLLQQLQT